MLLSHTCFRTKERATAVLEGGAKRFLWDWAAGLGVGCSEAGEEEAFCDSRARSALALHAFLLTSNPKDKTPTLPLVRLEIKSTHALLIVTFLPSEQRELFQRDRYSQEPLLHSLIGKAPARLIGTPFSFSCLKCQPLPLTHHVCICIFGKESKQRNSLVQYLTLKSNTYNVWLSQKGKEKKQENKLFRGELKIMIKIPLWENILRAISPKENFCFCHLFLS